MPKPPRGAVAQRIKETLQLRTSYSVFETPEEYRVTFDGRPLGTILITVPLAPILPRIRGSDPTKF